MLMTTKDVIIPPKMKEYMMAFQVKHPTEIEINNLEIIWLTLDEVWDPKKYFDDPEETIVEYSGKEEETVVLNIQQQQQQLKRYKFGIRVLFEIKQAMMLCKENGNTFWLDTIKQELKYLSN